MDRCSARLKSDDGFSLVEAMWVSVMTVVVLSAAYLVLETGYATEAISRSQTQAVMESTNAQRLITRYIRQTSSLVVTEPYRLRVAIQLDSDPDYAHAPDHDRRQYAYPLPELLERGAR